MFGLLDSIPTAPQSAVPLTSCASGAKTPVGRAAASQNGSALGVPERSDPLPPKKQNLYTAHEVLQIKPILNRHQTYEHFIKTNSWTSSFLANAYTHIVKDFKITTSLKTKHNTLSLLNLLAFKFQFFYMKPKITGELIAIDRAYFHPRDLSSKIAQILK